jgi:AraC family transcriptional regulator
MRHHARSDTLPAMNAPLHYRIQDYPAGSRMALHAHDDTTLCVLLAGGYEERVRGRSDSHQPSDVMICPAGTPHSQRIGAKGARKLVVSLNGATLDFLVSHVSVEDAPFTRSAAAAIASRRIAAELDRLDDFSACIIEGCLLELLGDFMRASSERNAPADHWLARVVERIREGVGRPLTMGELARAADRHPATVARRFRSAYGCTPGEYHRRLRVEQAARLIEKGVPLAEVADRTGFADQSHLTRVFRRIAGMTPGALRPQ